MNSDIQNFKANQKDTENKTAVLRACLNFKSLRHFSLIRNELGIRQTLETFATH